MNKTETETEIHKNNKFVSRPLYRSNFEYFWYEKHLKFKCFFSRILKNLRDF